MPDASNYSSVLLETINFMPYRLLRCNVLLDWSPADNGGRCVYERGKDAFYNVMINCQYFSGPMTLGCKLYNVS